MSSFLSRKQAVSRGRRLEIKGDTDLASLRISVQLNAGVMGVLEAENGTAFSDSTFTPAKNYAEFTWSGAPSRDGKAMDDKLLTLTCMINPVAEYGAYTVWVKALSAKDQNVNEAPVRVENSMMDAVNYTPGDVDGDGILAVVDAVRLARNIADGG